MNRTWAPRILTFSQGHGVVRGGNGVFVKTDDLPTILHSQVFTISAAPRHIALSSMEMNILLNPNFSLRLWSRSTPSLIYHATLPLSLNEYLYFFDIRSHLFIPSRCIAANGDDIDDLIFGIEINGCQAAFGHAGTARRSRPTFSAGSIFRWPEAPHSWEHPALHRGYR